MIKKIGLWAVLGFIFGVLQGCMSSVPAGNVGVLINKVGGDKGVDSQEKGPGRYWLSWNEEMFLFPTFTQTQVWTKDKSEGSPNDDSMTFQTREGLDVNTDICITYHIDPTKVTAVFQKYRKGVDEITHNYLRSMVRDALSRTASTQPIESVYGEGKASLIKATQDLVTQETAGIGIVIENIYLVGSLRLPDVVTHSINAKIAATQMAQQRENEVKQSEAEAAKAVAVARGEADSRLIVAEAEAKAISLKGDAINKNLKLIDLAAVEKWNGTLPQYMLSGSGTPFINLQK